MSTLLNIHDSNACLSEHDLNFLKRRIDENRLKLSVLINNNNRTKTLPTPTQQKLHIKGTTPLVKAHCRKCSSSQEFYIPQSCIVKPEVKSNLEVLHEVSIDAQKDLLEELRFKSILSEISTSLQKQGNLKKTKEGTTARSINVDDQIPLETEPIPKYNTYKRNILSPDLHFDSEFPISYIPPPPTLFSPTWYNPFYATDQLGPVWQYSKDDKQNLINEKMVQFGEDLLHTQRTEFDNNYNFNSDGIGQEPHIPRRSPRDGSEINVRRPVNLLESIVI